MDDDMKILIITSNPDYNSQCLEVAQYLLGIGSSITLAKEDELIWLDQDDYAYIFKDPSMETIKGVLNEGK